MAEIKNLEAAQEPWWRKYEMTTEQVNEFEDPEYLIDDLIIKGHLVSLCGEPNAGKTTIMFQLALDIATRGLRVLYVNADIAASDVKHYHKLAEEKIHLLLPDIVVGLSVEKIMENLNYIAVSGADLSDQVLIVDTLKKICDVNNKSDSRRIYKLFRALTGRGMTVILLSHTNKYKDEEGKAIFEGAGDHRADVDDLLMLIPDHRPDGSILVSIEPNKQRGLIEKQTYLIGKDRSVTLLGEFVDVGARRAESKQRDEDEGSIEIINKVLEDGPLIQMELLNQACKNNPGVGRTKLQNVLKRHSRGEFQPDASKALWLFKAGNNNSKLYWKNAPL